MRETRVCHFYYSNHMPDIQSYILHSKVGGFCSYVIDMANKLSRVHEHENRDGRKQSLAINCKHRSHIELVRQMSARAIVVVAIVGSLWLSAVPVAYICAIVLVRGGAAEGSAAQASIISIMYSMRHYAPCNTLISRIQNCNECNGGGFGYRDAALRNFCMCQSLDKSLDRHVAMWCNTMLATMLCGVFIA